MDKIILVGGGGHGRSLSDTIERLNKYEIYGYTDNMECDVLYPYLGTDDVLQKYYDKGIRNIVLGIGYLGHSDIRKRKYEELKRMGFKFPIIVDPSAIVSKNAYIEEGTFIGKNAVVNTNSVVGKMVIVNTSAIVEHDCKIGDFSHVAVNATLCGSVKIGDSSFVGASATIVQETEIGDHVTIGAGAVVTCHIEDNCVAVGIPAKVIKGDKNR